MFLLLIVPYVVLLLKGKTIQASVNLIVFLAFIYSMSFVSWEQGLTLYVVSIMHSVVINYHINLKRKNQLVIQAANKIIHD